MDAEQLNHEFENEYNPVYLALKQLEYEFPRVAVNQQVVIEDDLGLVVNTYAALLHSAQDTQDEATPHEIRQALRVLSGVVGFRTCITDLVEELFPVSVVVVEKLYFQNRYVQRYFSVQAKDRPDKIGRVVPHEWWYPNDRIEQLRDLVRAIWRDNVFETPEVKAQRADLRTEDMGG